MLPLRSRRTPGRKDRVRGDQTHQAIQQEIRAEKAGALARAVEALEAALADLARAEAGPGGDAAARERLVGEAGERLWYVVIQREAMGLRRHDVVYDVLRVPAAVRRAMGPRRRR
jgi:hypothetical protein